jgi:hypothetical protein
MILILMAVWVYGFMALTARADIYSWTDENGVTHFTNYAPPKHAKLLMKTPEIPYDEEADNQRREIDRLEVARQELAEREAFLLQEQQAAERRIAEANARADAALGEADRILQEAEAAAEDENYGRSNGYAYSYGFYPYHRFNYHRRVIRDDPWRHYYRYTRFPGHYHRFVGRGGPKKHDYHKRPKGHVNRRYMTSRSRHLSHQSRTALFRGRHGRY